MTSVPFLFLCRTAAALKAGVPAPAAPKGQQQQQQQQHNKKTGAAHAPAGGHGGGGATGGGGVTAAAAAAGTAAGNHMGRVGNAGVSRLPPPPPYQPQPQAQQPGGGGDAGVLGSPCGPDRMVRRLFDHVSALHYRATHVRLLSR